MKTLIFVTALALTALSGVVIAPQIAEAGLTLQCGWENAQAPDARRVLEGSRDADLAPRDERDAYTLTIRDGMCRSLKGRWRLFRGPGVALDALLR